MLVLLSPDQRFQSLPWFLPEQPGRLTGMHVLNTGNGAIFADRWPDPQVVLAETSGSYVLLGNPEAVSMDDLQSHIHGSIAAAEAFAPRLLAAFPAVRVVEKTVSCLPQAPEAPSISSGELRPLGPDDAYQLWGLSRYSSWICRSWGGPAGLAASGRAWGIFRNGRLVCVACSYYLGQVYEDVAVTTEPGFRGEGLSTACAAAVCQDAISRGHQPIWNAAKDNLASVRVAEKLGFVCTREYPLYYCPG